MHTGTKENREKLCADITEKLKISELKGKNI
jgi:hypothetical protein